MPADLSPPSSFTIAVRDNPFPGLRPFEADESELFFGRDEQADDLLGRLSRRRLVAVVGASGSGKSSLVRAGLLPALRRGYLASAGSAWHIATFRPGGSPIANLVAGLAASIEPGYGPAPMTREELIRHPVGDQPRPGSGRHSPVGGIEAQPARARRSIRGDLPLSEPRHPGRFGRTGRRVHQPAARSRSARRRAGVRGADHAVGLPGRLRSLRGSARSAERQPVSRPAHVPRSAARGHRRTRGGRRRPHRAGLVQRVLFDVDAIAGRITHADASTSASTTTINCPWCSTR